MKPYHATLATLTLAVLAAAPLRADEEDPGQETGITYQDITSPDEAPQRIQRAVRHHWKDVPDGTTVRIGIGQVFDFGHGGSSNQLEPALRSFVRLNAAGKPEGEETLISGAGRGEGRTVTGTVPWRNGVKEGVEKQFRVEEGNTFVAAEIPWKNGQVDGLRKTYYADGKLRSETTYRGGVPSGPAKTFGADGKLLRESRMKQGKRDGELKDYWPGTEQLKKVIPYRNGLVHGTVRDYYKDGTLKRESTFRDDRMHGEDKHFAADGTLERTVRWVNGDEQP